MAAPKHMTASERSMRASIAANARWANTDRRTESERARRAQLDRFEVEVDPDGTLDPDERARRADNARRAHMQRLALKSAQARRARKAAS